MKPKVLLLICLLFTFLLISGCGHGSASAETSEKCVVIDETLDASVSDIDIQWINGKITFEQTDSNEIRLVQVSPEKVKQNNSNSLDMTTTNGKIAMNGTFSTLAANTTNGDIDISCQVMPDQISLNGTNGGATLFLPQDDGFTLTYNKKSNFDSDFSLVQKDNAYIYQTGRCQIHVKITNGRLKLETL